MKRCTLCLVHQHPQVLLGMKKRGHGEGKWNGFGGKVMEHETVEEAARRELHEEAGIMAAELEHLGILIFEWTNGSAMEVHLFRAQSFTGELVESDEMRPQWFAADAIPFDDMWPDDRLWMPLFLEGKKFKGRCVFDVENKMLEHQIEEVASL